MSQNKGEIRGVLERLSVLRKHRQMPRVENCKLSIGKSGQEFTVPVPLNSRHALRSRKH